MSKWRGQDSNLRPRGYEPRELPDCSTPRQGNLEHRYFNKKTVGVEAYLTGFCGETPLAVVFAFIWRRW